MEYIISIPMEDGETEELAFPDTANMYMFLDLLSETADDISDVIIPEGGYV